MAKSLVIRLGEAWIEYSRFANVVSDILGPTRMLVERIFLPPLLLLIVLLLLKPSTEQELLAATRDAWMSSEVKDALGRCIIVN